MPQVARKVSDFIKEPEPFYPDAPRTDLVALVDLPITIIATRVLPDQPSKFGQPRDAILVAFTLKGTRDIQTTISSHTVIVKKLKELSRKAAWPVDGKIVKHQGKFNEQGEATEYYDLVD